MSDRRGFTLIEILVAFTIAVMALAAFMQAFGTGLQTLSTVEESNGLARILRSQAAMLSVRALDDGRRAESVDRDLLVQTTVQPLNLSGVLPRGPAPLEPVSVVISVEVGGATGRALTLRSIRLRPVN